MDPEYVTEKVNSHSGASFETILSFELSTISKILMCYSLIRHFPNGRKRYSSH